jgi:hypothetical protein
MKCINILEAQALIEITGLEIHERRQLKPRERNRKCLTVSLPEKATILNTFASHLAAYLFGWNPQAPDGILWLSNWDTYPPYHMEFLDKVRSAYGETRPIIEAPVHVFDLLDSKEYSVMTQIIFLVMAYNWEGYLLTTTINDYIYMTDELVILSCTTDERFKEAMTLAETFKLSTR